jgi:DNA-binding NarL/FixJ family response regulator
VLEVARQRRPRRRTHPRPLGLTEREIEVLRLIAHGCSNHQIAQRFEISRRTAGHHVQHTSTKPRLLATKRATG